MDRDNANLKARVFTKDAEAKREEEMFKEKWLMKYLALQKKNQEDKSLAEETIKNLKTEIQQVSDLSNVSSRDARWIVGTIFGLETA